MEYLIAISISLALFTGFLVLTRVEAARGVRVFSGARGALDKRLTRLAYFTTHIDWGGFIAHVIHSAAGRIAHDTAHATLLLVRTLERILTRLVKLLRESGTVSTASRTTSGSLLDTSIAYLRRTVRRHRASRNGSTPE